MGVSHYNVCFFFLSIFSSLFTDVDSRITPPDIDFTTMPPPLPPPLSSDFQGKPDGSSSRPSIAVMVGVITTIVSVTLLLALLYTKHCKRGSGGVRGAYNGDPNWRGGGGEARKNSGIDRVVIESLPIFRFSSLMGQKDGLECAVCLARFEQPEVLRLLPKCKHAFHVECVDTWLDAHSTCPLCRYRVDPEDILLIQDPNHLFNHTPPPPAAKEEPVEDEGGGEPGKMDVRRVSGRHSSAGERASGLLVPARSGGVPASFRRSLDSSRKKSGSAVAVGCFDRYHRKDGLLPLTNDRMPAAAVTDKTRFEHRIIVSDGGTGPHQRWSDVQPSDLLYLRSEMIISAAAGESGRSVINGRSVSEITGLNRFSNREKSSYNGSWQRQSVGGGGVGSRWRAWVSSLSQTGARSECTVTVA